MNKMKVMIIGETGQTGTKIVKALESNQEIEIRHNSRNKEQITRWHQQNKEAVYLDLDDPKSLKLALTGVDRIYLITSYSIAMVTQAKRLIDVAKAVGVKFIVHQGVYSDGLSTVPHFAWHELIERYIESTGIAWCHLHPNYFMENLHSVMPINDNHLNWYMADQSIGWVALIDLAEVAAKIISDGPASHAGKNYYLSSEIMGPAEVAKKFNSILDKPITYSEKQPEDLISDFQSGLLKSNVDIEQHYAASGFELMKQIASGELTFIQTCRDDVSMVLGRESTSFSSWLEMNKELFIAEDC